MIRKALCIRDNIWVKLTRMLSSLGGINFVCLFLFNTGLFFRYWPGKLDMMGPIVIITQFLGNLPHQKLAGYLACLR